MFVNSIGTSHTFALESFLPEGDTVWNTNPRVVADAFGVLDVSDESLDRVVLLCFRNDPLKDCKRRQKIMLDKRSTITLELTRRRAWSRPFVGILKWINSPLVNDCEYMNIIYLNCELINENERDRRNKKHHLRNSENKAWKKIQAYTGFEPMTPLIPV